MNPQIVRAQRTAAQIKQTVNLISEKVLLATTKAIGTLLHPMRAPDSPLEQYLETFTLGLSASEIHKLIDLTPYAPSKVRSYICYELGNFSLALNGSYEFDKQSGEVFIYTPTTPIRISVCPPEQLQRPLVARDILKHTTEAIAKTFWVEDRHPSTLENYLTRFSLELSVTNVTAHLDNHYPGWDVSDKRIYHSLGTISRVTRARFIYDQSTELVTIKPLEENQRVLLRGNLPVDKVQIAEEIINTTADAIGVMFYQADKPKCLMEHFLRDFDLQLSVTNVSKFLDEYYPGWETSGARCYYDLGNISPATSTRFIYNPENGSKMVIPLDDPKRVNLDSTWLSVNMMPKPAHEVELQFTVPEGMENKPFYMRPVVAQGAEDLNRQLNAEEEVLKQRLRAMASLFWVAAPSGPLQQFLDDFKWPTGKIKIKIDKTPLSYQATREIYDLMTNSGVANNLPELNNLFVRIEQIRYNPYLKGKMIYRVDNDTIRISSKVISE